MIEILRLDGTWFTPLGKNTTFLVDYGWYAAVLNGELSDCPVRVFILMLSAGF